MSQPAGVLKVAGVGKSGFSPEMVQLVGTNRLHAAKVKTINDEIAAAVTGVLEKHGLNLTRQIPRLEDNREMSVIIRASIIDANGFDSLKRDLLEYCYKLGYKPWIMNQALKCGDTEYQISGLDLSIPTERKFRLSAASGEVKYMSFEDVKRQIPAFFD